MWIRTGEVLDAGVIHQQALARLSGQPLEEGEEKLIASVLDHDRSSWMDDAIRVATMRLSSLPAPASHMEDLRRRRLRETTKLKFAMERAKSRAKLPFFVVMGDLHHSKQLHAVAESQGVDYYTEILEPLQVRVREIASSVSAEWFQDAHEDDCALVLSSAENAFLYCGRLCANIAHLEAAVLTKLGNTGDLPSPILSMKIGLVSVGSFEIEEMHRRIHLCSKLIVSSGELANDGSLYVVMPPNLMPALAGPIPTPVAQLPEGAVFAWDSKRLTVLA